MIIFPNPQQPNMHTGSGFLVGALWTRWTEVTGWLFWSGADAPGCCLPTAAAERPGRNRAVRSGTCDPRIPFIVDRQSRYAICTVNWFLRRRQSNAVVATTDCDALPRYTAASVTASKYIAAAAASVCGSGRPNQRRLNLRCGWSIVKTHPVLLISQMC